MNKQSLKTITETISNAFDEEISKINADKQKAIEEKNNFKEKFTAADKENKELKSKVKELEKALAVANKSVAKYEKIFETIKK